MGAAQRRKGPNVIGFIGILQPLADGLKLFAKEFALPISSNKNIFLAAPGLTFTISLIIWAVIPLNKGINICDLNLGTLYLFAVSSLNVYGIIFAGWSSNSKYAFLGAIRSAAQMISYEISFGLILLNIIICTNSFNLNIIVMMQQKIWFAILFFPIFIVFYISILAETNRHPFDLPEAEAELVSGYNVEYSSMFFALFFLGEYANILLMSVFSAILFLGGWLPSTKNQILNYVPKTLWLGLKIALGGVFFIITRAALPRYRYDQLMRLGWNCFLPLTLGYIAFTIGSIVGFNRFV
jgi:NADH-quinone oxidoreductase subunit H